MATQRWTKRLSSSVHEYELRTCSTKKEEADNLGHSINIRADDPDRGHVTSTNRALRPAPSCNHDERIRRNGALWSGRLGHDLSYRDRVLPGVCHGSVQRDSLLAAPGALG